MTQILPISEARKRLSTLLKELQKDPTKVYQISINEIVLGELRAPLSKTSSVDAGVKLLRLSEDLAPEQEKKRKKSMIALEHDKYLYRR